MNKTYFPKAFISHIILVFVFLMAPALVYGQEIIDMGNIGVSDEVLMIKGELETLEVSGLTRLSIVSPGVADIVDASDTEIELIANEIGQTALFVWDDLGKRTIMISVIGNDLEFIQERIKKLLKAAEIYDISLEVSAQEGKLIATGEVPSDQKEQFSQIIGPFNNQIVNFTKVEENLDLVQIDLQITELNSTLQKLLGVAWNVDDLVYTETLPVTDGSIRDFFKIGDFNRSPALIASIAALVKEGKGRILSKPKLVVVSGEEASFLVGGEIPIRTTNTTSGGSVQENVEFKDFGIGLNITPTIKRDKVDITLNLEVSEVDASTASLVNDDLAFSTRTAQTRLLLDDGQAIVLAGLIKQTDSENISKVPFVGDWPIIGALFRSRGNPVANVDQELVISLTPHILTDFKKERAQEKVSVGTGSATGQTARANIQTYSGSQPYYGVPREMKEYTQSIQSKITQTIAYPQEALEYGWEGTVKLGLLILNDGTLAFASVKESSGYDVFDEYALNTAKNAAPYLEFPSNMDLQELNVTIPIVYSLKRN